MESWGVACTTTGKHWCPVSTFACFRRKAFLGKPTSSRLVENTHGSKLDCRLYNNSLAPALGGACALETNTVALIQTRQIQAITTLPQRLSSSAQLTNCNVATCWQVALSILSLLQLSLNIHSSNGFICPFKFFHLKTAIGLALGES